MTPPSSLNPNPRAAQAGTASAYLSIPAASPTGFGNRNPNKSTGKLDAPTARTLFDVERWQAGREKPAVYGDRIDARLADANGEPLQIQATVAVRALLEAMPDLMGGKVEGLKAITAEVLPEGMADGGKS